MADVARHVTTEAREVADNARIRISTDLRLPPVAGDSVLLERLTKKLLNNAIRYNLDSHGEITVTMGTLEGRCPADC